MPLRVDAGGFPWLGPVPFDTLPGMKSETLRISREHRRRIAEQTEALNRLADADPTRSRFTYTTTGRHALDLGLDLLEKSQRERDGSE